MRTAFWPSFGRRVEDKNAGFEEAADILSRWSRGYKTGSATGLLGIREKCIEAPQRLQACFS